MWKQVQDKEQWNRLAASQPHARFLQSWQWGEFQKSLGREVKRLGFNNQIFAQAIKMPLPLGKSYWYVPHGPVMAGEVADDVYKELRNSLRNSDGALFARFDPAPAATLRYGAGSFPSESFLPEIATQQPVASTQPQCTSVLNLSKTEDEILAYMRQKTRYNMRLAEKKGVQISAGNVEDFLSLNKLTTERDKFISHAEAYYQKMIQSLPKDFVKIWKASYNGKAIACNIVICFGDTATYAHGASSNESREVMAPYLLQWNVIKDAQSRGYKYYDFWGVNPENENHQAFKKSWQGISRFKAGFGGEIVCYPDSFDLIFNKTWYNVYRLLCHVRRIF